MDSRCARLLSRVRTQATVETAIKEGFPLVGLPTTNSNVTIPFRERLGCSPHEACCAIGIGRTTLYKLIAEGVINVRKVHRRTIILVPSLLRLMDGQTLERQPRRRGRPRKSIADERR